MYHAAQQEQQDWQGSERNMIRPRNMEEGRDAADQHEEQQHEDASSRMIEGMKQGPGGSA